MSKIKHFFRSVFKWVIAILALGNLVYLFVFHYQLPGFIQSRLPAPVAEVVSTSADNSDTSDVSDQAKSDQAASASADKSADESGDSLTIQFPDEELSYDGSGSLDLIAGVKVLTAGGEEYSNMGLFTTIKSSKMPNEKIVEYAITDDNGRQVKAERTLTLSSDYSGPSISLSGEPSGVSQSDLARIAELLTEEGILHADDGFGRDISSSVTAQATEVPDTDQYEISLSVTNMLNDSYTKKLYVTVADADSTPTSGPVLTLTKSEAVLNVGDTFIFQDYIESAQDDDGTELFQSITVNGTVDTSTPGTYEVDMYCTNYSGETSPIKTLTVHVE